jgi:hypothetical protein
MKPAGGPYLTASEIGAFVYCFVPMTAGDHDPFAET